MLMQYALYDGPCCLGPSFLILLLVQKYQKGVEKSGKEMTKR